MPKRYTRESKIEARPRTYKRRTMAFRPRAIGPAAPLSMISDKKYLSGGTGNATNSDVGTSYYTLVGGIVQGITNSTRLGDEITLKWIKFHLHLNHTGATADLVGPCQYRFCLFYKVQANNTAPTLFNAATGLFYNTAANQIIANERAPAAKRQYKMLRDKMGSIDIAGGAANVGGTRSFDLFVPLKRVKVVYSATAGSSADIVTNALNFCIFSSQPATTNCTFTFSYTVCYTDA